MTRPTHFQTTLRMTLTVAALAIASASHAAYTGVISFGDSLTDTGNVYSAVPSAVASPPYYDGNFSDGPMWVERLSTSLGLAPETESELGGLNYAWAGATTTVTGFYHPSMLSAQDQVAAYLTDVSGSADPNALYTIWSGANDPAVSNTLAEAANSTSAIATLAQDLVNAGAQHILVLNRPDFGLLSSGSTNSFSPFTEHFNLTLAQALLGVTGGNIMLLDIYSLLNTIAANPTAYGLNSLTQTCQLGAAPEDCSNYFFYEPGHPGSSGQQIIADAAFATAVPIPAAFPLFLSALGIGALLRRLD